MIRSTEADRGSIVLDAVAIACLLPGMVIRLPDGEHCTVVRQPVCSVAVRREDGRVIEIDTVTRARLVETWVK
jgi:hypothetical protein